MWKRQAAEEGNQSVIVRWLRLGIVAAILLPTTGFAIAAWHGYRDTMSSARLRIDRAMRIGQEHASRVIETNEVITREILNMLGDAPDEDLRRNERVLHEQLKRAVEGIQQLQSVWVWDADGRPLVSNRVYPVPRDLEVADREYFQYLRTHRGGFFVSQKLISRFSGDPFIDIAHRRERAGGKFAGSISVSLRPQYFIDFYSRLGQAEPGLVVSMFRSDGSILARWPETRGVDHYPVSSQMMRQVQQGVAEGMVKLKSAIDGKVRLVAFKKLERYPVYLGAGIETRVILVSWMQQVAILALFAFPTSLGLAYVCLVALRRARREFEAVQKLRDETAQRSRAEEALRQAQKLEALGRLTGGVAHDFNNLLMVVNNNVHLLRRLKPELADSAQLAAISRSIASGEKLTRQLLAFSRRQALRPEVIRLQDTMPALFNLIKPAVGKGVQLSGSVAADTMAVEIDPAELELAIINLTMNAKDAMPEGGTLTISVRNAQPGEAEDAPAHCVAIDVADTGQGIPPELIEKVFEPFFTTKPPGKGTGLGLSQVYGLCVQAGGAVRVDSVVGKGTVIHLYLPATARAAEPAAAPSAQTQTSLDCGVLLVEDNLDVAEVTQQLLSALGCRVEHAASGEAAMEVLARDASHFDLVLSDIVMPGNIDGLSLARSVKQQYPGMAIILMTGYTAELQNAASLGVDVLPKPCAPEALTAAIARAVQRRREDVR